MRIEENRVYVFSFNTGDHGDLAIPVRGETRELAAARLQQMFANMQTELAMEFPKVSAAPSAPAEAAPGAIPYDVLEMRIDTLLDDLGTKGLTPEAKAKTIEDWTEKKFEPKNYAAIITELELLASGQKEVPTKPKKKLHE